MSPAKTAVWIVGILAALLALALLTSCEATTVKSTKKGVARVTFYNKYEDKWGNRIASSRYRRARIGQTVAAERTYPFGTRIRIPGLARLFRNNGVFTVEDRGSAVERRKASHGQCPVFDIYAGTRRQMRNYVAVTPAYLEYEIEPTIQ